MITAAEVGAALSSKKKPDAEVLREAMEHAETLATGVFTRLERAAVGVALILPDERLVFFGLHVLAAAQNREAYRPLIKFLHRREDEVDRLFGGNVTAIVPGIVISIFDGDPAPLIAAIEDPKVCERARWSLFDALTRLCADGAVSRETVRGLIVRFDDERLAGPCSLAWVGWQDAVALSGFSDLADRVRASWEDERNPATESERQDWEEMLVRSALDPTDKRAFEKRGIVPIDDPATALDQIIEPEFTSMEMPQAVNDPLARVALDADELGWLDYFLRSPKVPEGIWGWRRSMGCLRH